MVLVVAFGSSNSLTYLATKLVSRAVDLTFLALLITVMVELGCFSSSPLSALCKFQVCQLNESNLHLSHGFP